MSVPANELKLILTKIMKKQFCNQSNSLKEIKNSELLSAMLRVNSDIEYLQFEKHTGYLRLNNADMEIEVFDNKVFQKNKEFILKNYLKLDLFREEDCKDFICVSLQHSVPMEFYVAEICKCDPELGIRFFSDCSVLARRANALFQHRQFLEQRTPLERIRAIINAKKCISKDAITEFWRIFA